MGHLTRIPIVVILLAVQTAVVLETSASGEALGADCGALLKKGQDLFDQQKLQEAENSFRLAIQTCPQDAQAYKFLGLTYDQQNRFPDAQDSYRKAIALDPKNAGIHNDLAVSYYRSGNERSAVREFQATLDLDPLNVTANANLAAYYLTQREFRRAADRLLAAHADRSQDPLLLLELTQAYFGTGQRQEALAVAARLSQMAGSNATVRFSLGLQLAQNGEFKLGASEFSAIPDSERDSAVYMNLGNAYSKLGRWAEAKDAYAQAIKQDPSEPEPYLQIGLNSLAVRDLNDAIYWLNQAHDKAPQRTDITQAFAEALMAGQFFDRAGDLLSHAAAQTPNDPAIVEAQGDLCFQQHLDQQALHAYRRCLELDSRRVAPRLGLARVYQRLNQTSEAKAEFEGVLGVDPLNAEAHAGLGHIALQAGQLSLATQELGNALRQSPNDTQANEDLAIVKLRQGAYAEAKVIYERLVALLPNNPSYHYQLGQALLKLGNKKEAQREFTRSRELKASASKKIS